MTTCTCKNVFDEPIIIIKRINKLKQTFKPALKDRSWTKFPAKTISRERERKEKKKKEIIWKKKELLKK